MSIQSDYTVGLAKETTYGTYAVPTRFLEADATLKEAVETAQGTGMRPGKRVARASRRAIVKRVSEGEITLDATTRGLGYILEAFFGTSTSTETSVGSGVYQQVHTLSKHDFGPSYTVQQGIPRLGSMTTDAYTYLGAQCGSLSLEAAADAIVTLTSGWVARELTLEETYAAPSYPDEFDLFTFVAGGIYVGGTAFTAPTATAPASAGTALATVRSASVALDNGLDDNGWNLGNGGRRSRPAAYGGGRDDAVSGSFEVEYTGRDFVDAYRDQAELSMILEFQGPAEIATGEYPLLQISVPTIYLDGDLPTGNGGDVITVSHDWTGLQGSDPEPVYAVYRSLDTAL
ncbi:phage tail tube protein [Sanguibacter sp. HDW7]|uniref:phage tail tube protein n=1 Tax=Sanguibacter sp. HDW7 TaxID=2714931 RepID=UPI0014079707|nr:phage tail tube protein [Sanguibacter sp. HDW7]QIK83110.1 hypothetical protein G7063_05310 [Sanguibacter sp. HDW7]